MLNLTKVRTLTMQLAEENEAMLVATYYSGVTRTYFVSLLVGSDTMIQWERLQAKAEPAPSPVPDPNTHLFTEWIRSAVKVIFFHSGKGKSEGKVNLSIKNRSGGLNPGPKAIDRAEAIRFYRWLLGQGFTPRTTREARNTIFVL